MSSRLDRLLILLDTGSTPVVRSAAAKQLGDIQQSHPEELQNLLQKVCVYLRSKVWESRIAAGDAVAEIVAHVPVWGNCKVEEEDIEFLKFSTFSLSDVLRDCTPLLGSSGVEFEFNDDGLTNQRQRLSTELGLTVGNVKLSASEDLFDDSDLVQQQQQQSVLAEAKQSLSALLNGDAGLSIREKNRAKRKAKQLSRQNSLTQPREAVKRQKTVDGSVDLRCEWPAPEQGEWPLTGLVSQLLDDLINPEWELRHGAAVGLRSVLRRHRYRREWLVDVVLRLVTVLALDRFGDYVSHEVVAPVRETCSQVIGVIAAYLPAEDIPQLQGLFLQLLGSGEWQARHGGLLAIKYMLAARQDITTDFLTALLPHVVSSIADEDDDVKAVAAASLLPVTNKLGEKVPVEMLLTLTDRLWSSLGALDELSVSTSSIITLLAELLRIQPVGSHYQQQQGEKSLDVLVPRLKRFLSHSLRSVKSDTLTALRTLITASHGPWVDKVAALFARLLYQALFLEPDTSISSTLLEVWGAVLEGTSLDVRSKIVEEHAPLWLHLVGAPPGLLLDPSYFLDPPNGAQLCITMGGREFTTKSLLADALSLAATLTSPALFLSYLEGMLDSTCASHKLGACLVMMKVIERSEEDKVHFQPLTVKLTSLLTTQQSFDELIAAHQNLQLSCRGLLAAVQGKSFHQQFAQLPLLSAEHANALVQCCRQAGVTSTEVSVVETQVHHLTASSVSLSTRVSSSLAGLLIRLDRLTEKLNPLIKPLMETVKREASPEVQAIAAESIRRLVSLVISRKPCPTPKIIKNVIAGIVGDRALYPNLETTCNPFTFTQQNNGSGSCNGGSDTPTTPATPLTPGMTNDLLSLVSTLSKTEGMVTYLTQASSSEAKRGRCRARKSIPAEVELSTVGSPAARESEMWRRGSVTVLCTLAERFGAELLEQVPVLREEVVDLVTRDQPTPSQQNEEEEDEEAEEAANKLTTALYVLEHTYDSLHPEIQREHLLAHLGPISRLLLHRYTAVRHAAARALTAITQTHTVEVMNHVLLEPLTDLDSSTPHHRQGLTEFLHLVVKRLQISVVPYIVLLVLPTLRRMSDPLGDVRALATLTFAQLVRLMPLDAGKAGKVSGMSEELAKRKEEQKEFLEQLMDPSQIKDCTVSIKINATLRKYQQEGVNWLWFLSQFGLHGILCDDMGLGKTLQTLCIIGTTHENRKKSHPDEKPLPSLVVCPPTLIGHWFYETKKFVHPSDLSPLIYHGVTAERQALQRVVRSGAHNLIICSYEVLRNDADFFADLRWHYCVLDEGHVIKNTKSKVAQAIRGVHALHRLILSGTPIQNNVLELWALFDWLMPGFLGTERQFSDLYSKPISMSRDSRSSPRDQENGALALEALHRQVLPFLLRRMKEDVLQDLPPKIIQDYYCTLTPLQQELYDKFSERFTGAADMEKEQDSHVFQSLHFLRKVCNHPLLVLPRDHELRPKLTSSESVSYSGKLLALHQLLQDCSIGSEVVSPHRALIFCQLRSMLDIIEEYLIKQHLPNISYLRIDGGTPAPERVPIVHKFNSDPSYDILLLTTSVGGLGLNLTGADTVIFVEHDWNPSKDLQAMDRAHRIGQRRVVNVYRLVTKNTLEEKIMGLQRFKLGIANTVISSENSSLKQMGSSGLLHLFQQGEDEGKKKGIVGGAQQGGQPKKGLSSVLADLGDLWEDEEYEREYNLKSFVESLNQELAGSEATPPPAEQSSS